jgi:hypothetical protein
MCTATKTITTHLFCNKSIQTLYMQSVESTLSGCENARQKEFKNVLKI